MRFIKMLVKTPQFQNINQNILYTCFENIHKNFLHTVSKHYGKKTPFLYTVS